MTQNQQQGLDPHAYTTVMVGLSPAEAKLIHHLRQLLGSGERKLTIEKKGDELCLEVPPAGEAQCLRRLRQLRNQGAEFAMVELKPERMVCRTVGPAEG